MKKITWLAPFVLLASCASMQSHKNVELSATRYQGAQLHQPTQIYQQGSVWYLPLTNFTLQKRVALIKDPIFQGTEEDQITTVGASTGTSYYRISTGTARVLRNKQGYASLSTLKQEILDSKTPPLNSLSKASSYPVKAQFTTSTRPTFIYDAQPLVSPSPTIKALSWLDLIFVDSIGSVAYNVAIPFMAPYYFFKESIEDSHKELFHQ